MQQKTFQMPSGALCQGHLFGLGLMAPHMNRLAWFHSSLGHRKMNVLLCSHGWHLDVGHCVPWKQVKVRSLVEIDEAQEQHPT